MKKRILSLLAAACLVAALIPMAVITVFAEGVDQAIMPGVSGISSPADTDPDSVGVNYEPSDYLYFGAQDGTSPTKWRVLDVEHTNTGAAGMFLLSEAMLGTTKFDDDGYSNQWQSSGAQKWCINYATRTNFSEIELASILSVSKTDEAANLFGQSWGGSSLNNEKLFFLSTQEAAEYLANNKHASALQSAALWWLRSPDAFGGWLAGVTYGDGTVHSSDAEYETHAARPAFNLNLDAILFTSAADGGKVSSASEATAVFEIPTYSGNEWKTTLLDSSRSFTASAEAYNEGVMTILYSGAATGANEYISILIKDNVTNAYTHYGRVRNITETTESSRTVSVDLAGIDITGKTVYVFNEQYNGGANDDTKRTDYASPLVEMKIYSISYKDRDNADFSGTHGINVPDYHCYGTTTHLVNPSKTNYIFDGWFMDPLCAGAAITELGAADYTGDITLYAAWTVCDHASSTVQPTHTDDAVCSECGGTIEAIGHNYGTNWKFDQDNHWHECVCGSKADAESHTPVIVNAKEATESEKGYTGDTVCSICGYEIAKGDDIAVKTTTADEQKQDEDTTTPETGDPDNLERWIVLLAVSGLALTGITCLLRKGKGRNKAL